MPASNAVAAALCALLVLACCSFVSSDNNTQHTVPLVGEGVDIKAAAEGAAAKGAADARELESLLHWAIEHSDPDKLHELAAVPQDPEVLAQRRKEMQQVLKAMHDAPSETDLMKAEVAALRSENATDADKVFALQRLRDLVEALDNANDLKVLGGIPPLISALSNGSQKLQAAAASVLGTAAQNNVVFQQHVAEQADIIPQLLQVLQATNSTETAAKGVFALGTFLRNNEQRRLEFFKLGGLDALQNMFADVHLPLTLRKKVLDLVGDLAKAAEGMSSELTPSFLAQLVAVVRNATAGDWDFTERALAAAGALAARSSKSGAALRAAGLDVAVDNVRQALTSSHAQQDEDARAYAEELLQLADRVHRLACARDDAATSSKNATPGASDAAADDGDDQTEQPAIGLLGPSKDEL